MQTIINGFNWRDKNGALVWEYELAPKVLAEGSREPVAWWVPLLYFLLASWKEPPAHSAEAELLKPRAWIWALPGHLHFCMPSLEVFGDQIIGKQGIPTLGALLLHCISKLDCLKILVQPLGSMAL